jgi:hypothetical protein
MYILTIVFFIIVLFNGCSLKNELTDINNIKEIKVLQESLYNISQNPKKYIGNLPVIKYQTLRKRDFFFNKRYFKPWHIKQFTPTKKEAMWGFGYQNRKTFGMNYQPLNFDWYQYHKQNSNFKQYNSLLKKGVVIKNSNLRVLPTQKPIFLDPNEAGEGFPFDYNQVSSIYINTPILVSHLSKDKGWALVESNFTTGWIPVDDIAYLTKKQRSSFENGSYTVAVKDNFPLYQDKEFIDYIKLGTIFPKYNDKLLIVQRDKKLDGKLSVVTSQYIKSKPLEFKEKNILNTLKELQNEPYGWGGLYHTRDCSSMTRDFFSLFGIYLERNSHSQTFNGKYISFNNLTNEEKKQTILQQGKPFKTLIYLKGHIMLYVGPLDNEPILFHQFWGIKTKNKDGKEGREIIGRTIFSNLELGKSITNFDPEGALLNRAKGMVILNI